MEQSHGIAASPVRYRPDIDGLRAIAVIAVIIYHGFPRLLPGGFIGVDIFFVISGYLITRIVITDLDRGSFSFASFYARRIRRIFPALIIVLLATLGGGAAILLPDELTSLAKNAIAGALSGGNLMLLSEIDYFDLDARAKPLLHLWSLGIEEQFYLAWPLALWLCPPRWRRVGVCCLVILSFGLSVFLIKTHPAAAFYLPFTRAWELMAGAAITGLAIRSRRLRYLAAGTGFVGGGAFFLHDTAIAVPGWAALVPVIGTALTLLGEDAPFSRLVLAHRWTVFVGRISYPLYLWHWPLLVFAQLYALRTLTTGETVLVLCAAFSLAWITYEWIERPIRSHQPRRVVWISLAAMAAIPALALAAMLSPVQLPEEIRQLMTLPPPGEGMRVHACMLSDSDKSFGPDCIEHARPLVALWGDSTAGALVPGFRGLQSHANFGLAQLTVSSCPPLLVKRDNISDDCLAKNLEIVHLLRQARPEIVVLHALWVTNTIELKPTIDALRDLGARRIIILGYVPVWRGGLPNAVAAYYRRTGHVIPERSHIIVEISQDDPEWMGRVAAELGTEFISMRDALCDSEGCLTRVGNNLTTRDWLHLTPAGAAYAVNAVAPRLGLAAYPRSASIAPSR
jgi:peptidoglycan/LPS O-acetylase OafA/YrhL